MSKDQKIIKVKVGLLELAKQLGNVSQACKVMGYSRDSFYRFQELYAAGGETALQEISKRQPVLKNRVAPAVEAVVVALALEQPTWGQVRVANELAKWALTFSPAGVRCVWARHDLETMKQRLKALEAKVAQEGRHPHRGPGGRVREGEGRQGSARGVRERVPGLLRRAGHLLRRDVEGRGPDLPADVHRHVQQGGLREALRSKTPLTAADLLNDRVVPFFEEHGIPLSRMLTDRGTEYCGPPDRHEYELYLAVENIDHTRTKTKHPQTNGICERFNKTVLNEFYRVAFRKKLYTSLAELQRDLDAWLAEYNEQRTHQGRWCYGKTPRQTFLDTVPLAKEKMLAA